MFKLSRKFASRIFRGRIYQHFCRNAKKSSSLVLKTIDLLRSARYGRFTCSRQIYYVSCQSTLVSKMRRLRKLEVQKLPRELQKLQTLYKYIYTRRSLVQCIDILQCIDIDCIRKFGICRNSIKFKYDVCTQVWTVYLEQNAGSPGTDVYNSTCALLTDFWAKVTPSILQLVSHSKVVSHTIRNSYL